MSIRVKPISANLTRDTELIERMDPYVKIYFGGQLFRTSVCKEGGRNPFWNEQYVLTPGNDQTLRVQVWDDDTFHDDLVGAGSYNLMSVYNSPYQRADNQYVDLFYQGRGAGRILLSIELMGMQGMWGQQTMMQQPMGMGMQQPYGMQPMMNNGFGMQQPMMNNGFGMQPPMNNGWGGQPPMNNGWGGQPPMNNGWGGGGMQPGNGWNQL